jgi:ribosomal protein S18 acetylase RimI-like enzyme
VFAVADNQRLGAENLERAGAALLARSSDDVPELLRKLEDECLRESMIAATAATTDGHGTRAVGDAMRSEPHPQEVQLAVRRATGSDIQVLWLWRNDPLMRAMAKSSEPIRWSDHSRWFERVLGSHDTALYIVEMSSEPAAMVRFDLQDGQALVSINVAPRLRGRGIGTAGLSQACEAFQAAHPNVALVAEVRDENRASALAFRAAGFEETASDLAGFSNFIRGPVRAE